jgi:hypothetical protein
MNQNFFLTIAGANSSEKKITSCRPETPAVRSAEHTARTLRGVRAGSRYQLDSTQQLLASGPPLSMTTAWHNTSWVLHVLTLRDISTALLHGRLSYCMSPGCFSFHMIMVWCHHQNPYQRFMEEIIHHKHKD